MNRRSFLEVLAGAAAGLVLPEPQRVRAYSFLPGERRGICPPWLAREIEPGDFVAINPQGRLVRATPENAVLGQAYLVIGQEPAPLNGVYRVTNVSVQVDGQPFGELDSISWSYPFHEP